MKYYLAPDPAQHSPPYSATYSKIQKNSILVPSEQQLATKIFLHKTPYTTPSFPRKVRVLHRRCF